MLREEVDVLTGGEKLKGHLFVGKDGLPELEVKEEAVEGDVWQTFRPAEFPAAWRLMATAKSGAQLLLAVWWMIEVAQTEIAKAQREADDEERDKARQQSIDNQVAAGRIVAGGGCSNESGS